MDSQGFKNNMNSPVQTPANGPKVNVPMRVRIHTPSLIKNNSNGNTNYNKSPIAPCGKKVCNANNKPTNGVRNMPNNLNQMHVPKKQIMHALKPCDFEVLESDNSKKAKEFIDSLRCLKQDLNNDFRNYYTNQIPMPANEDTFEMKSPIPVIPLTTPDTCTKVEPTAAPCLQRSSATCSQKSSAICSQRTSTTCSQKPSTCSQKSSATCSQKPSTCSQKPPATCLQKPSATCSQKLSTCSQNTSATFSQKPTTCSQNSSATCSQKPSSCSQNTSATSSQKPSSCSQNTSATSSQKPSSCSQNTSATSSQKPSICSQQPLETCSQKPSSICSQKTSATSAKKSILSTCSQATSSCHPPVPQPARSTCSQQLPATCKQPTPAPCSQPARSSCSQPICQKPPPCPPITPCSKPPPCPPITPCSKPPLPCPKPKPKPDEKLCKQVKDLKDEKENLENKIKCLELKGDYFHETLERAEQMWEMMELKYVQEIENFEIELKKKQCEIKDAEVEMSRLKSEKCMKDKLESVLRCLESDRKQYINKLAETELKKSQCGQEEKRMSKELADVFEELHHLKNCVEPSLRKAVEQNMALMKELKADLKQQEKQRALELEACRAKQLAECTQTELQTTSDESHGSGELEDCTSDDGPPNTPARDTSNQQARYSNPIDHVSLSDKLASEQKKAGSVSSEEEFHSTSDLTEVKDNELAEEDMEAEPPLSRQALSAGPSTIKFEQMEGPSSDDAADQSSDQESEGLKPKKRCKPKTPEPVKPKKKCKKNVPSIPQPILESEESETQRPIASESKTKRPITSESKTERPIRLESTTQRAATSELSNEEVELTSEPLSTKANTQSTAEQSTTAQKTEPCRPCKPGSAPGSKPGKFCKPKSTQPSEPLKTSKCNPKTSASIPVSSSEQNPTNSASTPQSASVPVSSTSSEQKTTTPLSESTPISTTTSGHAGGQPSSTSEGLPATMSSAPSMHRGDIKTPAVIDDADLLKPTIPSLLSTVQTLQSKLSSKDQLIQCLADQVIGLADSGCCWTNSLLNCIAAYPSRRRVDFDCAMLADYLSGFIYFRPNIADEPSNPSHPLQLKIVGATTFDSLLISWKVPEEMPVSGFDIYVNDELVERIRDSEARRTLLHPIDMQDQNLITICALDLCGIHIICDVICLPPVSIPIDKLKMRDVSECYKNLLAAHLVCEDGQMKKEDIEYCFQTKNPIDISSGSTIHGDESHEPNPADKETVGEKSDGSPDKDCSSAKNETPGVVTERITIRRTDSKKKGKCKDK